MSGEKGELELNRDTLTINSVEYNRPTQTVVVVGIDGGDPKYIEQGLEDGIIPNIERMIDQGFYCIADSVVPSYTNPNNISIITGSPPSVHGISANFFIDPETGEGVPMTDPKYIRVPSILAEFSRNDAKVVAITAKDKLRRLLGKGINIAGGSVNFSSEKADQCTPEKNGIDNVLSLVDMPLPEVYSADLSLFVLEAGVKILERDRPDLMYLFTTDFIQHKYAPGTDVSNKFLSQIDNAIGRLIDLGAIVGVTADHGMNERMTPDGKPNVIYLQDEIDKEFGTGAYRVVLTLKDQYVVHHSQIGGYTSVYCQAATSTEALINFVSTLPGVEAAYDSPTACELFDLPPDRQPDVIVMSSWDTGIGSSESEHDFSDLQGFPLRTHGGVSDQPVPFIVSAPLNDTYVARAASGRVRNWHIYDYVINGTRR